MQHWSIRTAKWNTVKQPQSYTVSGSRENSSLVFFLFFMVQYFMDQSLPPSRDQGHENESVRDSIRTAFC